MTNPREIAQNIDDVLGVADPDNPKGITVSSFDPKEIVKFQPGQGREDEQDKADDYSYARTMLQTLAEQGQEALNAALELAVATGNYEAFETVASILKANAELVDRFMSVQEKNVRIQTALHKLKNPGKEVVAPLAGPTTNNFVIATTDDVIRSLADKGLIPIPMRTVRDSSS